MNVESFVAGRWIAAGDTAQNIHCAVSGEVIAQAGSNQFDTDAMLSIARDKAGSALREMTFHERANGVKALATLLNDNKDALTELSFHTGATKADSFIDIDGGIGTMFVFASKAKRELPDDRILMDGATETLSRHGTFLGQHIYLSLIHI